ncbi:MT-A70 family methyltransferase [Mesorhizobium sp.]|uniref:MT-A70 family methyltransferase n=1 Tax=Mesorhizobium sp. TaxID=1871066 RepID=UPI003BAD6FD1
MSDLQPHPLAELFPMLPEQEMRELADDIVTYGQREPIVLLDGMVLDGRNRLAACRFADVEPVLVDFEGDDPLGFVLSLNLHRRHLSESQRAMVAARLVDWDRGINQATAGSANLPTREAARRLSISERAVIAAKRIRDHGTPELVEAIRDGRVSVHAGEALSDLAVEAQREVLALEEKRIVARAKEIRAARQKLRHTVRLAHMDMVRETGRATSPGKLPRRYSVGYADPPWKFGVHSEVTGREKSAENHYPTMTTDEIIALFRELDPFADNAVFFCWATNPMLLDGLRLLDALGFTYVHHWIWDKEVAGTGYWGRDRHEILLIGRRGDVAAPLPGSQPETVHRERKTRHSAKPDFYAETIERLFPGIARLELFCRSPRPGWDHWGFEAGPSEGPVDLPPAEKAGEIAEQSGPPATDDARPSVTAADFAEFRMLGAIADGIGVSGPLFESLQEQGLIWAGKELSVGGAKRLAELGRLVDAASDGDAVNVQPNKRGFKDALSDWTELNKLKARGDDLTADEAARLAELTPVVEAELAAGADKAPKPKRARKAVPA